VYTQVNACKGHTVYKVVKCSARSILSQRQDSQVHVHRTHGTRKATVCSQNGDVMGPRYTKTEFAPTSLLQSTATPASSRASAASTMPHWHATCRGVAPSWAHNAAQRTVCKLRQARQPPQATHRTR
jgi:hypothetical protein